MTEERVSTGINLSHVAVEDEDKVSVIMRPYEVLVTPDISGTFEGCGLEPGMPAVGLFFSPEHAIGIAAMMGVEECCQAIEFDSAYVNLVPKINTGRVDVLVDAKHLDPHLVLHAAMAFEDRETIRAVWETCRKQPESIYVLICYATRPGSDGTEVRQDEVDIFITTVLKTENCFPDDPAFGGRFHEVALRLMGISIEDNGASTRGWGWK